MGADRQRRVRIWIVRKPRLRRCCLNRGLPGGRRAGLAKVEGKAVQLERTGGANALRREPAGLVEGRRRLKLPGRAGHGVRGTSRDWSGENPGTQESRAGGRKSREPSGQLGVCGNSWTSMWVCPGGSWVHVCSCGRRSALAFWVKV